VYFKTGHERAFGTFPLKDQQLEDALETALDVGYRAIDTAQMYANEKSIGKVLTRSAIARDALFITSKVPTSEFSQEAFIPSVEKSLSELQISMLDVLLVHWPPGDDDVRPSLDFLQQAKQQGLAKHIGISNYNSEQMRTAQAHCSGELVVNQVEFHPLLNQQTLLATSNETGIPLASYCSVARGKVFEYALFEEIGKHHDVTAAQVVLRWILQHGVSINPMSTKRDNITANFDAPWLDLSPLAPTT